MFIWALFTIYLAAFTYLADWCVASFSVLGPHKRILKLFDVSYGPFASSASAGQSLTRESSRTPAILCMLNENMGESGNIMATAFPLFTHKMFAALTYKWGNTIFAIIATLMVPIPFVSPPNV